jgi:hypothetical protein
MKESIFTAKKTDNPNNIDQREAYQLFIFEEVALEPHEVEGK